jgi:hypothetical protein
VGFLLLFADQKEVKERLLFAYGGFELLHCALQCLAVGCNVTSVGYSLRAAEAALTGLLR